MSQPSTTAPARPTSQPSSGTLLPAPAASRGGVEEDRGLEALAADPEEADEGDGQRAEVERPVEAALELTGDRAGGALHPEDHRGDEADRDDARRAADELLRLEGQLAGAVGEDRAEDDREGDGGADAEPDVAVRPRALRSW